LRRDRETGWWTGYKGLSNTEEDYALWQESEANMRKAKKIAGNDVPVIRVSLAPIQDKGGWLTDTNDRRFKLNTPEGYRQALRELARSIE
jgi:hypothetical protein